MIRREREIDETSLRRLSKMVNNRFGATMRDESEGRLRLKRSRCKAGLRGGVVQLAPALDKILPLLVRKRRVLLQIR